MRDHPSPLRRLPGAAMVRSLGAALARLRRDARGNVLMITALALIPLTYATGMVIDYSRAARLQTKLNAAADAAALSGTTKPMLDKPLLAACNAARRTFRNALEQSANGLVFDNNNLAISVTESYAGSADATVTCPLIDAVLPGSFTLAVARSVTVRYTGQSTNAFGGVLRANTIEIGGLSTAKASTAAYYQIAFIVDVSNSMGIGGTPAAIASLQGDPQIGCAFACHDPNSTGSIPVAASGYCENAPADYFCRQNAQYCPWGGGNCGTVNPSLTYSNKRKLAKAFNYKLKIDFVNDAVTSFINALQPKMTASTNGFAVSIGTFGTTSAQLQATTTSWSTLRAGADRIDLEVAARSPAGYPNQGWTYTANALQTLRTGLTNVGDGTSPTARKTYVIFISDGVEDVFNAANPLNMFNRVTNYDYAAQCELIKDAGVTMFSIETAYPNVPSDTQYNVLVRDLPGRQGGRQIADVMRDCASSPSRYFLANDGPGIQSAVDRVFALIDAETSRLSQ